MIKWVLRRAIDKFEQNWKYDASYMRDMIDASPRAAWTPMIFDHGRVPAPVDVAVRTA